MMRLRALAVVLLLAPCSLARANPMLHAQDGAVVDSSGKPVILRCVNLSPWLNPEPYLLESGLHSLTCSPSELKQRLSSLVGPDKAREFWEKWTDAFVTEEDFRHLGEQGFNCVRLPINYRYVLDSSQSGAVALQESSMAPIDHAVAWGARHGLWVMLDLHVAPGSQSDVRIVADLLPGEKQAGLWEGAGATANRKRTVELWRALAIRYARATSVGGYDLLNEPRLPKGVPVVDLSQLYADSIGAIRTVDPLHMVILEGNGFARDFTGLSTAPDPNAMFEFHEYALFNNGWKKPSQQVLAPFLKLRTDSHLPLWLGEFGEATSQWQGQMVKLMQDNQIGWSIWPWKRIELKNQHPVIQTITLPDSWKKVADYLVGAWFSRRPTPGEAEKGMSDMLQAIQTPNCREDAALERTLSGSQP